MIVIGASAKKRLAQLKHRHVRIAYSKRKGFFVQLRPFHRAAPVLGSAAKKKLATLKGKALQLSYARHRGLFVRIIKAPSPNKRERVVGWARWANQHSGSFHYSQTDRVRWISEPKGHLPITTDCSGFMTWCYWMAGCMDVLGLGATIGFTGTTLQNAKEVTYNIFAAEPGDPIVIGPGTGDHEVVTLEAGPDPLVASHGHEGVQIIRLSVDPRTPKRVCKYL